MANNPFSTLSNGLSPSGWNLEGFRARFYRQFNAKQDAVEEILRVAVRPDRSELTDVLVETATEFAKTADEGTTLPSEVVEILSSGYFVSSVDDEGFALQMLAWVTAREHDGIKEDMAALYASLDERTEAGLEILLTAWGRTPVEPFTWVDIAKTLTAANEGFVLQHDVDSERVAPELVSAVAIAILAGMTKHEAEKVEHVRDRFDL